MNYDWTYGLDSRAPWNEADIESEARDIAKAEALDCGCEWFDFITNKFAEILDLEEKEMIEKCNEYAHDEDILDEFFEEYKDEFYSKVA